MNLSRVSTLPATIAGVLFVASSAVADPYEFGKRYDFGDKSKSTSSSSTKSSTKTSKEKGFSSALSLRSEMYENDNDFERDELSLDYTYYFSAVSGAISTPYSVLPFLARSSSFSIGLGTNESSSPGFEDTERDLFNLSGKYFVQGVPLALGIRFERSEVVDSLSDEAFNNREYSLFWLISPESELEVYYRSNDNDDTLNLLYKHYLPKALNHGVLLEVGYEQGPNDSDNTVSFGSEFFLSKSTSLIALYEDSSFTEMGVGVKQFFSKSFYAQLNYHTFDFDQTDATEIQFNLGARF